MHPTSPLTPSQTPPRNDLMESALLAQLLAVQHRLQQPVAVAQAQAQQMKAPLLAAAGGGGVNIRAVPAQAIIAQLWDSNACTE